MDRLRCTSERKTPGLTGNAPARSRSPSSFKKKKEEGGREDEQEGKQGIGGRAKAQDIEKDGWQS